MKTLLRTLALLVALVGLALPGLARAAAPTVAVLYFENQGNPQLEPLKVGLAQMLITDLQGTPGVRVVERAQLQAILDELQLGHDGKVDPDTAAKVGKLLGAQYMVMGSYFEMMGTLRIDARLVRVETGEIVHASGVNDAAAQFMGMEDKLARDLQGALGSVAQVQGGGDAPALAQADTPAAPSATRGAVGQGTGGGSSTAGPAGAGATSAGSGSDLVRPDADALAAAVAFSEGLMALDRQDSTRAREAFQQALQADPSLEAARVELASMEI